MFHQLKEGFYMLNKSSLVFTLCEKNQFCLEHSKTTKSHLLIKDIHSLVKSFFDRIQVMFTVLLKVYFIVFQIYSQSCKSVFQYQFFCRLLIAFLHQMLVTLWTIYRIRK